MQKNAKKQLKIEIKILDKNLTACLMSRPAKTRILNPAIVLQGSRCLQIGLHSSKIRGAAGCTPTLCFLIGLSRYVEVFETLLLREKMSIKGPLKSLRKKSKGRKGWLKRKRKPLLLPHYPSNTQRVEQMVRVVTEASTARVGYEGRQSLIVQKLKSRKLVKSFNSKMQDAKFD